MSELRIRPIRKTGVRKALVAQLRESIAAGEVRPGDRLPSEQELARQFGVNRTTVREALQELCALGLLEVHRGRGTFVTSPSEQASQKLASAILLDQISVLELLEARTVIEGRVAAFAAQRATDSDVTELRTLCDQLESNVDDVDIYLACDTAFHLCLAKCTGNKALLRIVDTIRDLLGEQQRWLIGLPRQTRTANLQHRRILDAISSHDEDAAIDAITEHLNFARDSLVRILAEREAAQQGGHTSSDRAPHAE
jgi:GntR family transcriptional repressor for pyruvate dehydrogenase complex